MTQRKVRCPNCTALLAEPPYPVFECPICSTLLLAKEAPRELWKHGEILESSEVGSSTEQVKGGNDDNLTEQIETEFVRSDSDEQIKEQMLIETEEFQQPPNGAENELNHVNNDYQIKTQITNESEEIQQLINGTMSEFDPINTNKLIKQQILDESEECQQPINGANNEFDPINDGEEFCNESEEFQQPMNGAKNEFDPINCDEQIKQQILNESEELQQPINLSKNEFDPINNDEQISSESEEFQQPMNGAKNEFDPINCDEQIKQQILNESEECQQPINGTKNEFNPINSDEKIKQQISNTCEEFRQSVDARKTEFDPINENDTIKRDECYSIDERKNKKTKKKKKDGAPKVNESEKIEKDEEKEGKHYKIDVNEWILHDIDFSFKYTLLASNQQNNDNGKKGCSHTTDCLHHHSPLRVKLSEQISGQNEAKTGDEDEDEDEDGDIYSAASDFDFPVPSANHLQDATLADSFIKSERSYPNLANSALSGPHKLEFRDAADIDLEFRKLHIDDKYSSSQLAFESNEIDSIVVGSGDATQTMVESDVTMLINGSSEQLPGTGKFANKVISLQELTYTNNTKIAQTRDSFNQLQYINGTSALSHEPQVNNPSSNIGNTHHDMFTDDQEITKIGTKNGNLSNAKERQDTFFNNGIVSKRKVLRPSLARRNLPQKLQLYDNEGRLMALVERKKNNEDMAFKIRNVHNDALLPNQTELNVDLSEKSQSVFSHNLVGVGQSYGYGNHHRHHHHHHHHHHHYVPETYDIGSSTTNRTYSYQESLLHPPTMVTMPMMQEPVFSHPTCMSCLHLQHSSMPQSSQCFSRPSSMTHESVGQSLHGVHPSVGCAPTFQLLPRYDYDDASNAEARFAPILSSSTVRTYNKQYPPLPRHSAPPYIICKACDSILRVPYLPPINSGMEQKLRCGECGKVCKFRDRSGWPPQVGRIVARPSTVLAGEIPASTGTKHGIDSLSFHEESHLGLGGRLPRKTCLRVSDIGDRSLVEDCQGAVKPSKIHGRHEDKRNNPFSLKHGLKAYYARSIHRHVDEEEEILDFGAPLVSDSDSIDLQSESRTRSPENIENQRPRKLGSPLIVLLNQGSRKFSYVDPPSSSSLLYDDNNAKLDSSPDTHSAAATQSHGYHSIRRTPQYIASLLRRSLRGVGKDQ